VKAFICLSIRAIGAIIVEAAGAPKMLERIILDTTLRSGASAEGMLGIGCKGPYDAD
jgi:hypothetical protein